MPRTFSTCSQVGRAEDLVRPPLPVFRLTFHSSPPRLLHFAQTREQPSKRLFYCLLVSGLKPAYFSSDETSVYSDDLCETNKRRLRQSGLLPFLQDNIRDKAETAKTARHHGDHIMLVHPSRPCCREDQAGALFRSTQIRKRERDQDNIKGSHTPDRPRYPIPGRIAPPL